MISDQLSISIGGDTVPTITNERFLVSGQEDVIFNNVKDIFLSSDWVVVNLECPLTDQDKSIRKAGPCLKAKPGTIQGLMDAGITVFSLANNHIMDFGAEGLKETLTQLADRRVLLTGAAENLKKAREPLILEKKGIRIALISVAEHEFSIAEEDSSGANPFDPFDTIEDIRQAKGGAAMVIVLYHGGIEHYPLPSPSLQRVCRKMVENGADYVICQHSHCIGAYEKHLDGHIVYGQGNLLFDHGDNEMWQTGLILRITIEKSKSEIEFLPILRNGAAIDLAENHAKEEILQSFHERSKCICDKSYIEREWSKFCDTRQYRYLQTFLGFGKLVKRIDNRLGNFLTKTLFGRNTHILLYDFLNCESHLEIARSILKRNYLIRKE